MLNIPLLFDGVPLPSVNRMSYRQYGQAACGSSAGYVDGIPVTIADQYRPPSRVLLPASVQPRHVCDVLEEEYEFELEKEAVEEYASYCTSKALEEKAQVENIASEIEDFSRSSPLAVSSSSNLTFESECIGVANASCRAEAGQYKPAIQNGNTSDDSPEPVTKPSTIPFSQSILQPTPIVASRMMTPKEDNKLFKVTDFETVQDPFDDLELEVLDDMAELKNVLEAAQTSTQDVKSAVNMTTPAGHPGQQVNGDIRLSNIVVNDRQSPLLNETSSNALKYNSNISNVRSGKQTNSGAFQNTSLALSQGLTDDRCLNQNEAGIHSDLNGDVNQVDSVSSVSPERSKISPRIGSKWAPLPPIRKQLTSVVNDSDSLGNDNVNSFDNFANNSQLDRGSIPTISARNNYNPYSRHSYSANVDILPPIKASVNPRAKSYDDNMEQTFGPRYALEDSVYNNKREPSHSSLRSARSTPDISSFGNSQLPLPRSSSPPSRSSAGQMWNPYMPLPPSPDLVDGTVSHHTQVGKVKQDGLNDPFCDLDLEEQELTMSIVDMGFPRSRVSRAVKHLGKDDKLVIDHLCQVNRLTDCGYTCEDAESSLHQCDNNFEKAKDFLDLQSQFEEMGFTRENIREALKRHSNRDEAFDYLTSLS